MLKYNAAYMGFDEHWWDQCSERDKQYYVMMQYGEREDVNRASKVVYYSFIVTLVKLRLCKGVADLIDGGGDLYYYGVGKGIPMGG